MPAEKKVYFAGNMKKIPAEKKPEKSAEKKEEKKAAPKKLENNSEAK